MSHASLHLKHPLLFTVGKCFVWSSDDKFLLVKGPPSKKKTPVGCVCVCVARGREWPELGLGWTLAWRGGWQAIEMCEILVGALETWKEGRGVEAGRWREEPDLEYPLLVAISPPPQLVGDDPPIPPPPDRGHSSEYKMCQGFPMPPLMAGGRPGSPRSLWLQGPLL